MANERSDSEAQENAEEMMAKDVCKKLYRKFVFGLHVDSLFADFGKDHPLFKEGEDLAKKLNDVYDTNGTAKYKNISWRKRLEMIENMKSEIDDFTARAEEERTKNAQKAEDTKDGNNKQNESQQQPGAKKDSKQEDQTVKGDSNDKEKTINEDFKQPGSGLNAAENANKNIREKLEKEVADAREAFARKDYEITTVMDRLRRFFGSNLKTDSQKINDTKEMYDQYKSKIDSLIEFQIKNLKQELEEIESDPAGPDPERSNKINQDIKNLIFYFHKDEKLNLFEARTSARAEAKKGKWDEKILKKGSEMINWWRKLPLKYKIPISMGMFAVGTAVPPAKFVFRAFSAASAGTGLALGLEAISRKKESKKSEEFVESLTKESINSGDRFETIMSKLKEIDYQKSLKIEQTKSSRRIVAGVAMAGIAGSGALNLGFRKIWGLVSDEIGDINPYDANAKGVVQSGIEKEAVEKTAEKTVEKSSDTVLEIKKGGSFEKALIEHLKTNPNLIEKYNEINGGREFNAGQIAHRMALDFAEGNDEIPGKKVSGLNLVHEGSKITINPETMEIQEFEDQKGFGELPEKHSNRNINVEDVKNPPAEINQQEIFKKELSEMDTSDKESIMRNLHEKLGENQNEINSLEEQPASRYNTNEPWRYDEDLDKLKVRNKEIWSDIFKENSIQEVLSDARKEICVRNIDNWRQIKDLPMDSPAFSHVNEEVKARISGFYFQSQKIIGDSARPKSGETIAKWTERIVKLIVRKK